VLIKTNTPILYDCFALDGIKEEEFPLGHCVYVARQFALNVRCLVLVDVVVFSQLVHHGDYLVQKSLSFSFVFKVLKVLDRCSGRFLVVTVVQTNFFVLANSF
jgi:hypothetical protein